MKNILNGVSLLITSLLFCVIITMLSLHYFGAHKKSLSVSIPLQAGYKLSGQAAVDNFITTGDGSHCDFSHQDLRPAIKKYLSPSFLDAFKSDKKISFFGANLSNTNLSEANLMKSDMTQANLTQANLTKAQLFQADLTDANATGANFTGAELVEVKFIKSNLTDAILSEAIITEAKGMDANITRANLAKARIAGGNFTNANLNGANFSGATLSGTHDNKILFDGANFIGAHFDGAKISGVSFVEANLFTTDFSHSYINIEDESELASYKTKMPNVYWVVGRPSLRVDFGGAHWSEVK